MKERNMAKAWQFSVTRCALTVALVVGGILADCDAVAQTNYQPAPENLKARREFQDAKFGMFIHWGVYSILGAGEWSSMTAH